jgi:hypothetical protein
MTFRQQRDHQEFLMAQYEPNMEFTDVKVQDIQDLNQFKTSGF